MTAVALHVPPGLVPERERRLENIREYAECFVECPVCPAHGFCSLCLSTAWITKGTARFMEFGFERGVA